MLVSNIDRKLPARDGLTTSVIYQNNAMSNNSS